MRALADAWRKLSEAFRLAAKALRKLGQVWAQAERNHAYLTTLVPFTPDGCHVCQVDPPVCESCSKPFKRGQLVGQLPVGMVLDGDDAWPAEVLVCAGCYLSGIKGLGGY